MNAPEIIKRFFASLYVLGARAHRLWLKRQNWSSHFPPLPLLVVGSYRMGGGGKTSLTIFIGKELEKRGIPYAVMSYGVYSKVAGEYTSDDAALIKSQLNAPVFVTRNRLKTWEMLSEKKECHCILSDDGLQDPRLAIATHIVCHPKLEWPIRTRAFPWGKDRAILQAQKQSVNAVVYEIPFFFDELLAGPMWFTRVLNNTSALKEHSFVLVSAVGNPKGVEELLARNQLAAKWHRTFPDHSTRLKPFVERLNRRYPHLKVAITQKDAMRFTDLPPNTIVIEQSILCSPSFTTWLDAWISAALFKTS